MINRTRNFAPKMYGLGVMARKRSFSGKRYISKGLRDIDLLPFVNDRAFKNTDKLFLGLVISFSVLAGKMFESIKLF